MKKLKEKQNNKNVTLELKEVTTENYNEKGSNWCKEKKELVGTDQENVYTLVDVHLSSTVTLACHYCDEFDDEMPKVWYKKSRDPGDKEVEVETGFSGKLTDSRIFNMPDHTLVIQNVSEADNGVYFCHGPLGEDTDLNYNYIIDVLSNIHVQELTEPNLRSLDKILFSKIDVMNSKFRESNGSEFSRLRNEGILMNVMTSWTSWDPCNGCLKIKKRKRRCYIRPTPISNDTKVLPEDKAKNISEEELSLPQKLEKSYLIQYDFACRSLLLANNFPEIAKDLESIPDYYITETCYAPCPKFRRKEGGPKYENNFILEQGGSATFVCPESTYNDKVVWKKDGSTIEALRKDTHLQVDMFATLYIRSATHKQNGNYTCFIKHEPIQQINIVVRTKSIFQSEDFHNHLQYLGFIFVISFIIYLIGVISAGTQKRRFKIIDFDLKDENEIKEEMNRENSKVQSINKEPIDKEEPTMSKLGSSNKDSHSKKEPTMTNLTSFNKDSNSNEDSISKPQTNNIAVPLNKSRIQNTSRKTNDIKSKHTINKNNKETQ